MSKVLGQTSGVSYSQQNKDKRKYKHSSKMNWCRVWTKCSIQQKNMVPV